MRSASTWKARPTRTWPKRSAATRRRSTTPSSGSSARSTHTSARARFSSSRQPRDLVVGCEPDSNALVVSWRIDTKHCAVPSGHVLDGNEVGPSCLSAEDPEVIDLTLIIALRNAGVRVMGVGTACVESDGSASEAARLALHPGQSNAVIDYKVVPRVLSERNQQPVSRLVQCKHDREGRPVSLRLWMLHASELA